MIFIKNPENNAILVSEDCINWQEATIADVYAELVKSLKENEELKKYKKRCARLLKIIDYLNLKKRGVELVSMRGYVELACPFRTKSILEREIALNKEKATEYYFNYLQAQKKNEKLKEKLEICKNALKKYAEKSDWTECWDYLGNYCGSSSMFYPFGYETAQEALENIEELKQDD